jgi:hypothetical protein
MSSVLVLSEDARFLERLGNSLHAEGLSAVCLDRMAELLEIVEDGFCPEAIVVDPALVLEPGGGELVRCLTGSPVLAAVPVFSISSVMKRMELQGLVKTLRRLDRGDDASAI